MKKINKLSASILALNAVFASYSAGNSANNNINSNRLYNNIVNNIEKGNSNSNNYKFIERILNLKNKELKNLYLEGDYIVKPEYLEWQLFFSGFYSEYGKGVDNSKENSVYHSKVTGYYDSSGNYVVTSGEKDGIPGKPYQPLQKPKDINLSADIPIININKKPLEINMNLSLEKPEISKSFQEKTYGTANLNLVKSAQFSMEVPNAITPETVNINIVVPSLNTYNNVPNTNTYFNSVQNLPSGSYDLSTVSGTSRDNGFMNFNTSNGGGSYYSEEDTVLNVDIEKRRAVTIDARNGASYTFTNNGTILLSKANTAGLEFQSDGTSSVTRHTFINDNLIEGKERLQAAFLFTQEDTNPTANAYYTFQNDGTVKMDGSDSAGISIAIVNATTNNTYWDISAYNNGNIILNGNSNYGIMTSEKTRLSLNSIVNNAGKIEINGEESVGIAVLGNSKAKFENTGEIEIINTKKSSGFYGNFVDGNVLNSNIINIVNSESSSGIRSEAGIILNDGIGVITISGGEKNIGMLGIGNNANIKNSGNITVNGGEKNLGLYLENNAVGSNDGIIAVDGQNLTGVSVVNKGIFTNTGKLEINGINTQGLYSDSGTIISSGNGLDIDLEGEKSIGVFSSNVNAGDGVIDITDGNIAVKNGGLNFYSKGEGSIKLDNITFQTGEDSLAFYTKDNGKINIQNSTGTVKSGGTAFYLQSSGSAINLENLLSTAGINFNNLTLNMDSDSRLFSLVGGTINLSVVNTVNTGSVTGLTVNGDDYTLMLLHKGNFIIDEDFDLDNTRVEMANSSIENNSVVRSQENNRNAMAQENSDTNKNAVLLVNNGEILMSGLNSIGMYANNGIVKNNNLVSVLGADSQGLYGINGTEIENTGNIAVGTSGIGIAVQSYKTDEHNAVIHESIDNGNFTVNHSGSIKSEYNDSIGVYANNNDDLSMPINDKIINLNTNSLIDLSRTKENGIGVYLNKSVLFNDGIIKTGTKGAGVYSLGGNITLNGNSQMDMTGDDSYGYILKNNSSLTAAGGVINVTGNNNTIFTIDSGSTISGLNNINLNIDENLTITLALVKNNAYAYGGILTNLGKDSALIIGENSNIEIASGGNIISRNDNVSALVALGGNAVNNGEINLSGADSVGIYTDSSAVVFNNNKLTVGSNGVGIYNADGIITNNGIVKVGEKGTGLFGVNSALLDNSGTIESNGVSAVGIYANSSSAALMQISNSGNIDLSGENSVGIYSTGINGNIDNNFGAEVRVGDSVEISNPGVGIYSAVTGSTINNFGMVKSGAGSVGIYSSGGTVNNNGILDIGAFGVGIYTKNGTVDLAAGSTVNLGTSEAAVVYGVDSAVSNNADLHIGNGNYGFILKNGSLVNTSGTNSTVGSNSVFMYGTGAGAVNNNGAVIMTGSDNVSFYTAKDSETGVSGAVITNTGIINGTAGKNNVGIYNYGGTVSNSGTISVGDSGIIFVDGTTEVDVQKSKYSVGVYGENAVIVNHSAGIISAGRGGYGIVAKGGTANNFGMISTNGDYSTGMYTEGGIITNENGAVIDVSGNNAIGMYGKGLGSQIINHGIINITGENTVGMYAGADTVITNTGTINITGNGQGFVALNPDNSLHNIENGTAQINGVSDNKINGVGSVHALPELINAGIIKSNGVLALDGLQIMIKPDPTTKQPSSNSVYDFELSGTSIIADHITTSKPIVILPGFADGTNANVYKLEGVISASSGKYDFISGSLLWEATPQATGSGADVYMSRKSFTDFTDGLWFEDFGTALENNYLGASGKGVEIYNKTGYITNEENFRHIMASLAGNVYANINQRENDITESFENSLHLMQNSSNNTKENVKVNVIAGKGKNKEETDGVTGYDYTTTGVLALREVERTYKHTFGYSLGYLHTGFEFQDGNESEEWVDTVQLGVHNKYKTNGWTLRNDLTGRVSIHNIDRNIDWSSPLGRSEMNGTYETYSITSDNILGKEIEIGKKASIMPYGAFRAMYIMRPDFTENGLEALEIEGNDAWSAKPRVGIEVKGSVPLGEQSMWQLKGTLDFAYEYELGDLNERENGRLAEIENDYHKLAKPQDEKGIFRTKAAIGLEIEDRYGIFLTGEYAAGNDNEDNYRMGVTLKAVF